MMGLDKIVDLLIQFLQAFQFAHIIEPYHTGIISRMGHFHRLAEPGFRWVWPFYIESVITASTADDPLKLAPQSLTTSDGKRVVVSAMFTVKLLDAKKFLLTLQSGMTGVTIIAQGVLARFVETRTWDELTRRERDDDETEEGAPEKKDTRSRKWSPSRALAVSLRKKILLTYGVDVLDAQLTELTDARSYRIIGIDSNFFGGKV